MIKSVTLLVFVLGCLFVSGVSNKGIRYFQTPTIPLHDTTGVNHVLINDSIYQVKIQDGIPLFYYTLLNTGVCFDNICRPLKIITYWNITGRYLGFELPGKEFLSKYDHEPFNPDEYSQLNYLLSNPFLPLDSYSFYELLDVSSLDSTVVDGYSGATSKDIMGFVVEGAAFTTYKLWNVIYGPAMTSVIEATEKELDANLYFMILQSTVSADRIWAAERTGHLGMLDEETIELIINLIRNGEYSESYLILRSLTKDQLDSEFLQNRLFQMVGRVDYAIENLIFEKLKETEQLNIAVLQIFLENLESWSDMQIVNILKLFKHHDIKSSELSDKLIELSASKTRYIKNQIQEFTKD